MANGCSSDYLGCHLFVSWCFLVSDFSDQTWWPDGHIVPFEIAQLAAPLAGTVRGRLRQRAEAHSWAFGNTGQPGPGSGEFCRLKIIFGGDTPGSLLTGILLVWWDVKASILAASGSKKPALRILAATLHINSSLDVPFSSILFRSTHVGSCIQAADWTGF